ncbi:MmcQ/YjbR family DNA-binding protein [Nonomuraea sp. NPDC050310]|uniref:MmcQ/YjbR family DNA-binding protein n=1 Tax=unclassified Nonomuraea TaxID=2593643 RepID=UPI00340B8EE2
MGVSVDEFLEILERLPEVKQGDGGEWVSLKVRGKGFGYLWEKTRTVGLKATIEEQQALVNERPHVFEEQFTAGRFGWVVVRLDGIEADELEELVDEAWCLTAPKQLVDAHEAARAAGR